MTVQMETQGPDTETQFWTEVKASGAKEYFDAYLKKYPKGKYLALAKAELKKLEQIKLKDQLADLQAQLDNLRAKEQQTWDQAKAENNPNAYSNYLQRYPKGRYVALADAAKQKLQREATERERAAQQSSALSLKSGKQSYVQSSRSWGQSCNTEMDCSGLLRCNSGVCADLIPAQVETRGQVSGDPQDAQAASTTNEECSNHGQCGTGRFCKNQRCAAPQYEGASCTVSYECAGALLCRFGVCSALGLNQSGMNSEQPRQVSPVQTLQDSTPFQQVICGGLPCVSLTGGESCRSHFQCSGNLVCRNRVCVKP